MAVVAESHGMAPRPIDAANITEQTYYRWRLTRGPRRETLYAERGANFSFNPTRPRVQWAH